MTRSEIRTEVQSNLGITLSTTSRVTIAEVDRWIDQTHRVAVSGLAEANVNYFSGETDEQDTDSGEGAYDLPNDFLKLKRVQIQWNDDEDMKIAYPMDINDVEGDLNPGEIKWSQNVPRYALWADQIEIRPIPDEDSDTWSEDDGAALKLWYIKAPADLADGTAPSIPPNFHQILAHEPTAKGLRRMQRYDDAKVYDDPGSGRGLWQTGLAKMLQDHSVQDMQKNYRIKIRRGRTKRRGIFRP